MSEVDLSQLMGGKGFTVSCILSRNRNEVTATALADTGANAFVLVDTNYAARLSKSLDTPLESLPRQIPIKGYDRRMGKFITSFFRMHLRVDGRNQYNVPFLITDLGQCDMILGRKWLAYLDIWLDVRNR
jgi:predicted aspartyl protease